jgi:hypothetical protein
MSSHNLYKRSWEAALSLVEELKDFTGQRLHVNFGNFSANKICVYFSAEEYVFKIII